MASRESLETAEGPGQWVVVCHSGSTRTDASVEHDFAPEEKRSFFEFSPSFPRACLGKKIVFIYKWLKSMTVFALAPAGGEIVEHRWPSGCT